MNHAITRYAKDDELVAERFIAELAGVFQEIVLHPDRWPRHVLSTHRLALRGFPFHVVYRVHGDVARVIAIAHMKRDPAYWHGRR
jgi:toxin ParE1/3/4